MPTRSQVILCWLLFTGTMGVLSLVLHAIVPPAMSTLQGIVGVAPLGAVMLAMWVGLAIFIYPPLVRSWLARRRSARIRQR